jgi:hypothetical protein
MFWRWPRGAFTVTNSLKGLSSSLARLKPPNGRRAQTLSRLAGSRQLSLFGMP